MRATKKSCFAIIIILLLLSYCAVPWYLNYPHKIPQRNSHSFVTSYAYLPIMSLQAGHLPNNSFHERPSPAKYYCNFVSNNRTNFGNEGKQSSGWKLKQVHIVIRHGDRTPLSHEFYEKKNMKPDFCNINKGSTAYNIPLFKQLVDQIKKYRLIHLKFFSASICKPAQLTTLGMLQLLHNGRVLRDRYFKALNLTGLKKPFKAIQVYSTYNSRTISSAISFMFGFIPNFQVNQFSLKHVKNVQFCLSNCLCQKADVLMDKLIKKRKYRLYKERQKFNKSLQRIASDLKISDRTGAQADKLVTGFLCKGLKLPCSSSGNCITNEDLDVIMDEQEHMNKVLLEESPARNQSLLQIHSLLSLISKSMDTSIKFNQNNNKLILYSGHDSTVRPLLAALDIKDYRWPRLASRFIFELWEFKSEHYLKVLYNGKDVTSSVTFCNDSSSSPGCNFKKFSYFVNFRIFQLFGATTKEEACAV